MGIAAFRPTATVTVDLDTKPGNHFLPDIDNDNQDVELRVDGMRGFVVFVAFGAGAKLGANVPGCIRILPGETVLLTTGWQTAPEADGPIVGDEAIARWAAGIRMLTAFSEAPGAKLTICRGKVLLSTLTQKGQPAS